MCFTWFFILCVSISLILFSFSQWTYQESHFSIFNWHSLIMFLTDWSGIRDGVLCVNAPWIIHTGLSEWEKEHFRNQLAMPLTMNNWSELIKVCRDYPSPPQQIKCHTCVCCLFSKSPLFLFPFTQTCFIEPHVVTQRVMECVTL